ncbi:c-type cytochrome [Neobacillus endophyticus]|uniref:c-type cytochrome n=1 Tax=Neobacillus endophyticus TaxID=2738405 RepID=UPI001C27A67D|nr:cytochrome c [Neobacillus endophyticus]
MERPAIWITVILFVASGLFVNVTFLQNKNTKTEQSTEQQSGQKTETTASSFEPKTFYKQTCNSCHGDHYQGVVGPSLKNLSKKYSQADVENILKNGKSGGMPAGLVPQEYIPAMAKWVLSLK